MEQEALVLDQQQGSPMQIWGREINTDTPAPLFYNTLFM